MSGVVCHKVKLAQPELEYRLHGRGAKVVVRDVAGDLAVDVVREEIGAAKPVLVVPELDPAVLDQVARAGGDGGHGYGELLQAVDIAVCQASRAGFRLHNNIRERACIVYHVVIGDYRYLAQDGPIALYNHKLNWQPVYGSTLVKPDIKEERDFSMVVCTHCGFKLHSS